MVFSIQKMQEIVAELGNKVRWETCCSHLEGKIVSYKADGIVFIQHENDPPIEVYFSELEFLDEDGPNL